MLAVIFIIGGAVISEFSNYLKKKKFMKIFIIAFLIMQKRSQSAVMIMN